VLQRQDSPLAAAELEGIVDAVAALLGEDSTEALLVGTAEKEDPVEEVLPQLVLLLGRT